MKKKRPLITGTVLWYVIEHLYYVPGRAGPLQEYCVSSGILTGYYDGTRYTEFCIRGYEPGKGCVPRRYKTAVLGKCVFLNPWDAARLAKQWTEHEEKAFWFCHEEPMRRTWEKWLITSNKGEDLT